MKDSKKVNFIEYKAVQSYNSKEFRLNIHIEASINGLENGQLFREAVLKELAEFSTQSNTTDTSVFNFPTLTMTHGDKKDIPIRLVGSNDSTKCDYCYKQLASIDDKKNMKRRVEKQK